MTDTAVTVTVDSYQAMSDAARQDVDRFIEGLGIEMADITKLTYDDGVAEISRNVRNEKGRLFRGVNGEVAWEFIIFLQLPDGQWFEAARKSVNV